MTIKALSAALPFAFIPISAAADQAEGERTVRALLAPFDPDPSARMVNRFGTATSTIGEVETPGYSFQSAEGPIFHDQDKNPVSMFCTSGESHGSADDGKTDLSPRTSFGFWQTVSTQGDGRRNGAGQGNRRSSGS